MQLLMFLQLADRLKRVSTSFGGAAIQHWIVGGCTEISMPANIVGRGLRSGATDGHASRNATGKLAGHMVSSPVMIQVVILIGRVLAKTTTEQRSWRVSLFSMAQHFRAETDIKLQLQ